MVKKGKRKGGAWWTEEDRKFAKEKKGAYRKKILVRVRSKRKKVYVVREG